MALRAVKADALYVIRSWFRHPASIGFSLVLPVFLLLSFGFLFSSDAPEAPRLLVEDLDGSDASAGLVAFLSTDTGVDVSSASAPSSEIARWMQDQKATGYLRIPAGYGASVSGNGSTANLSLLVNGATPYEASLVRAAVTAAAASTRGGDLGVDVDAPSLESPIPYSSFLLPGVIGLNVLVTGIFMSFTAVMQLRTQGLLERLAISPVRKAEWLLGRMIGISTISLIITVFLVLVAVLVFRTPLHLSVWAPLLVIGGTLVFAGLGTILAVAVRDVEVAMAVGNLAIFPILLTSGAFFDVSTLPTWLQWLPKISPLTYVNDGLRDSLILGKVATPALYTGILLAMAAVVVFIGGQRMRWTRKD